jgi:hypothetical protein
VPDRLRGVRHRGAARQRPRAREDSRIRNVHVMNTHGQRGHAGDIRNPRMPNGLAKIRPKNVTAARLSRGDTAGTSRGHRLGGCGRGWKGVGGGPPGPRNQGGWAPGRRTPRGGRGGRTGPPTGATGHPPLAGPGQKPAHRAPKLQGPAPAPLCRRHRSFMHLGVRPTPTGLQGLEARLLRGSRGPGGPGAAGAPDPHESVKRPVDSVPDAGCYVVGWDN